MRNAALLTGLTLSLAACGDAADLSGTGEPQTSHAALGSLVVNEHSAGTSGWVELFNSSASAVDVSGFSIDDVVGSGAAAKALPSGSLVPAGGFLVVAYAGFNTASADTVNLLDATGAVVDTHASGWAGSSIAGLCFGRQPDGGEWAAGAIPCSRGASNGSSVPPAPVTVVVNEFQAGTSGWVELYNAGAAAADLTGYTVDDVTGGGSSPKAVAAGTLLQPKAFLVVSFGGINTASADAVNLLDPTGTAIDTHSNFYTGSSVSGLCFGRRPDGGAWASASIACTQGATNGEAVTPPAPQLSINEFQAGSSGWVEVYNAGTTAADLTGWAVDDVAGGGSSPKAVAAGTVVPPKSFAVVSFGGVNTASADEVRLLDAAGALVDSRSNSYAGSSVAGLCFGRQPDGGAWAAGALPCTQGASNGGATPPPPAKVLINELYPGSSGFVELYNAGSDTVDLTGWKVDDVPAGGASPKAVPAGTKLLPGKVVQVAFGGVNVASADEVRLLDPAGVEVDARANAFGLDPCYGADRCWGRVPDGGPWATYHLPCSGGAANPATAPDPCLPGSPCDDGNACTSGDACSASCVCTSGPALSCDDQNPCTTDACWPASGCAHPLSPDGTFCGPSLQCMGGVCGGSTPTPCAAAGGTYKTVAFTLAEECKAVEFLNKARYSQMASITTTARDIAYDCSPASTCGYRTAAWATVAEYAAAHGVGVTQTVGTSSLVALKAASEAWTDDGLWYDTVARAFADRASLNGKTLHFESVFVESASGLCMLVRDAPGAPNYLSACVDPWFCGPEGCAADLLDKHAGTKISLRGTLTNESGSYKVAVKSYRAANPKVP